MKSILLGLCILAAVPAQAQRPMNEMHGDCANYATKLDREFELWAGTPTALAAAASAADGAPVLAVGQRYEVALPAHGTVRFAAAPEQDRGAPDRFSGVTRLSVPAAGTYRVSASNGLWIDVVDGAAVTKSATFEMQTKCPTIFKTVTYRLEAGRVYWLQLSGSRTPAVGLLVSRAP